MGIENFEESAKAFYSVTRAVEAVRSEAVKQINNDTALCAKLLSKRIDADAIVLLGKGDAQAFHYCCLIALTREVVYLADVIVNSVFDPWRVRPTGTVSDIVRKELERIQAL